MYFLPNGHKYSFIHLIIGSAKKFIECLLCARYCSVIDINEQDGRYMLSLLSQWE